MSEDEAAILEAHCDAAPTIPLLGRYTYTFTYTSVYQCM